MLNVLATVLFVQHGGQQDECKYVLLGDWVTSPDVFLMKCSVQAGSQLSPLALPCILFRWVPVLPWPCSSQAVVQYAQWWLLDWRSNGDQYWGNEAAYSLNCGISQSIFITILSEIPALITSPVLFCTDWLLHSSDHCKASMGRTVNLEPAEPGFALSTPYSSSTD